MVAAATGWEGIGSGVVERDAPGVAHEEVPLAACEGVVECDVLVPWA